MPPTDARAYLAIVWVATRVNVRGLPKKVPIVGQRVQSAGPLSQGGYLAWTSLKKDHEWLGQSVLGNCVPRLRMLMAKVSREP